MTVAELIQHLQKFPQHLRVVTPGPDEFNYEDIDEPYGITVVFFDEEPKEIRLGRHINPSSILYNEEEDDGKAEAAVLINF